MIGHRLSLKGAFLPMTGIFSSIWPFSIEAGLNRAYGRALSRHGATAQGVFWNSPKSQRARFSALLGLVASHAASRAGSLTEPAAAPSVADIGCGYGAMLSFMQDRPQIGSWPYLGLDINPAMIAAARQRLPHEAARFAVGKLPPSKVDYALFSGTFNLCLIDDPGRWQRYILESLAACWPLCRQGMALNLLCQGEARITARIYYADQRAMVAALRRFGNVQTAPTRGVKHDVTFLVSR